MREENYFNPRLGALLRVPFREVYRISRSTPFGRLRSCTPMYTPFDASRKITRNTGEPIYYLFKQLISFAFAPIRSVSRSIHARLHLDDFIK